MIFRRVLSLFLCFMNVVGLNGVFMYRCEFTFTCVFVDELVGNKDDVTLSIIILF